MSHFPKLRGVALRMKRGTVYSADAPKLHGDVIHSMAAAGESLGDIAEAEQGFLDEGGNFYNRWQVARVASDSGQVEWAPTLHRELYSEDVW